MSTHGEVSWNDNFGGEERKNNKDLFLRLEEGENIMRLVTQPYQYLVHKYKKEDDKGYGQKISCSAMHGSCPLCDLGDKAKRRWFLGVISRKTGTYKVLDISYAVFSQIKKLAQSQHFGDPSKYDIVIVVDKNGGATGYYSVQALGKEPLSAHDQQLKDNADLDDLKRRSTPPTADVVQKRMDKINGVDSKTTSTSSVATKPKTATVAMENDDEGDSDFPPYAG